MYQRLRENDPVHKAQTGEWIISKYEDARSILRNPEFTVGNRLGWMKKSIGYLQIKEWDFSAIEKAMHAFILFLNPPEHTRIRKFIQQAWSNHNVERLIRSNLDLLLSKSGTELEFVNDMARPLPSMTISKILGLPEGDYAHLKELGSAMVKALDLYLSFKEMEKINDAAKAFMVYFQTIIGEKEKQPDNGLISSLIETNKTDKVLNDEELLSSCILLFIAGEETSVGLLGTGLMNLLKHPGQLAILRENPSAIPGAIEELIRYDGPVQIVGRFTSNEVTIRNKIIPAGSTLTICLGSANRDPEQFENPDELNFKRNANRHLGFGGGAHYCMGDWLARIQMRLTLETLLERFKKIEIVDLELKWNRNLAIRSLAQLKVRCSS
jgi:hypothetical protein